VAAAQRGSGCIGDGLLVTIALGACGCRTPRRLALKQASTQTVMLVWDGLVLLVLFLSMISIATELQRSESIDLGGCCTCQSDWAVFIFNYVVSLVSMGTDSRWR